MPSTIVLNSDLDVCPALGSWISNNKNLLKGFSLLIAEDVIADLALRYEIDDMAVTSCRASCWRCGPVPIPVIHVWMNSHQMENPGDPSRHIKRGTIEPPAICQLIRPVLIEYCRPTCRSILS